MGRWVVKTVDQAGRKVFINVCGSSRVSLPGSWKHGKVRPARPEYIRLHQNQQFKIANVCLPGVFSTRSMCLATHLGHASAGCGGRGSRLPGVIDAAGARPPNHQGVNSRRCRRRRCRHCSGSTAWTTAPTRRCASRSPPATCGSTRTTWAPRRRSLTASSTRLW